MDKLLFYKCVNLGLQQMNSSERHEILTGLVAEYPDEDIAELLKYLIEQAGNVLRDWKVNE